jgi:hypothetical protein
MNNKTNFLIKDFYLAFSSVHFVLCIRLCKNNNVWNKHDGFNEPFYEQSRKFAKTLCHQLAWLWLMLEAMLSANALTASQRGISKLMMESTKYKKVVFI